MSVVLDDAILFGWIYVHHVGWCNPHGWTYGFEHHCSHLHDIITFMALFAFLLLSLVELPVRFTFDVSCHFK